ncbi:hypothetical protein VQL36_11435 [Chengkuizengella sp. SCS-71B]|uniref:hypothetical protein n=1 Tax=Chengkuizengella sp. SCS-71B TaxID=3115290 RepID=UPI0032C237D1
MPLQPETLTNLNGSKKVGINKIVKGFTESTRTYPENFNQALQTLIDNDVSLEDAQVGLIRNSIHSGFLDISDLEFGENKIILVEEQVANINGYLLTIPEGTEIELPEAPTEGKRDDLVFLEAWFPIEGNGYDMSWRIRSVAGVDFEKFSEGLTFKHDSTTYNFTVQSQGSNEIPLNFTDGTSISDNYIRFGCFYDTYSRGISSIVGKKLGLDDVGVYLAGDGTQESKDILQTADGYVYAIPMFRIPRRNSGGYSVENVNGAREYVNGLVSFNLQGGTVAGEEITSITEDPLYSALKVGDFLQYDGKYDLAEVIFINGDGTITYLPLRGGYGWSERYHSPSDRPDNLYSNIIDQRDIIDLRHKVSLTGEDYNKIMNEEFNQLLAGENGNVEMKKEYFGLDKAPSFVEVQQESYPYVVENLIDIERDVSYDGFIDGGGLLGGIGGYSEVLTLNTVIGQEYTLTFEIYNTNINSSSLTYGLQKIPGYYSRDESIYVNTSTEPFIQVSRTFTAEQNQYYLTLGRNSIRVGYLQLTKGSQPNPTFVPHGKWYVPADYTNQETNTRFDLTDQKRILSDAQTSQKVTDKIEVLSDEHLPHIEVTQATKGVWTAGDTIKITCKNGLFGLIDTVDNSFAKVVRGDVNSTVLYLDDVSEFSVGDSFLIVKPSGDIWSGTTRFITAINSTEKTIQFEAVLGADVDANSVIIKSIVKADGIVGKWDGVLTNESTYTIITPPNNNKETLTIEYRVNYPGGNGIEHVPTEVLEGEVNRQKLVKSDDGIVTIKANFEGKTSEDTDLIPHTAHPENDPVLFTPNDNWGGEIGQFRYDPIMKLNSEIMSTTSTATDDIPQIKFSFNIIRAITDKLGEGFFEGCVTIEDKVQRSKDRLKSIGCNWWGYGECPNGNKAILSGWRDDDKSWYFYEPSTHTNSAVTNIIFGVNISDHPYYIDDNGFVHFLAYTDPSDGVTASIIYTDYVELEIQVDVSETGYDVLVPENEFPVMNENLLTQNQAFPVDLHDFEHRDNGIITIEEDGLAKLEASVLGDGIRVSELNEVKLDERYTFSLEIINPTNVEFMIELYSVEGVGTVYHYQEVNNTNGLFVINFSGAVTSNLKFQIYSRSNSAVSFSIKNLKLEKGINENPTWSEGRKSKTTLNYLGKVVGDDVSVPHRVYIGKYPDLTPDDINGIWDGGYVETNYNNIQIQNGNLNVTRTGEEGKVAQTLFEFDLSHIGLSLSELKDKLRKLTVSWTGYGQGDDGNGLTYGAKIQQWDTNAKQWVSNGSNMESLSSIPTTISSIMSSTKWITNNQKVYILVHSTHPAGVNSNSIVYTDYIKLDVELSEEVDYVKSNVVKVRKETKELKMEYPIKDYRTGITDSVALWYEHVPYQGLETKNGKILSLSDNLVITTRGTGSPHINEYSGASPQIPILSYKLPKGTNIYDHMLLNEAIILNNHSTYSSANMPLIFIPKINHWKLEIGRDVGYYTNSIVPIIGEDLAVSIPHLSIAYALATIEGEFHLRVYTNYSNGRTCITGGSATYSEVADYKVKGNILIKEV